MRLLDTETGQLVEKDSERTRYAPLSHAWDTEKGEQTYKELKRIQGSDQISRHTVSWTDGNWEGWGTSTVLKTETVTLGAGGAGMVPVTLDLGLRLAGAAVYIVNVDIFCDVLPVFPSVDSALPAPSAVG